MSENPVAQDQSFTCVSKLLSTQKKPKKSRTWRRRKEELQQLRKETTELEIYLQSLKDHQTFVEMLSSSLSEDQRLWKATALSGRQRLRQAFEENNKLKDKLACCKQTVASLKTCVTQAQADNAELLTTNALTARALTIEMRFNSQMQVDSSILFDKLEFRLQERQGKMGDLFGRPPLLGIESDKEYVQVIREDDAPAVTIEFKYSRLLPFSAERTSNVAWNVVEQGAFPNQRSTRITGRSNSMLATEACFAYPLDCGGSVHIRAYCLIIPIVVVGEFVLQVETQTEWCAFPSSSANWSYVTRDSGWTMVRPVDVSSKLCQTQTMLRLSGEGSTSEHSLLSRNVSGVVISSIHKMMKARFQVLDNALLDLQQV